MEKIDGFLDVHALPCIRIWFKGGEDPEPVYVDTGFNRALLIPSTRQYELAEGLRWEGINERRGDVAYADGRVEEADLVIATIRWFGVERDILGFVYTPKPRREKRKDSVLLGTELLVGCKLEVDFANNIVRITRGE